MKFKCKSHVNKDTGIQWNIYKCECGREKAFPENNVPQVCGQPGCRAEYLGQRFGRLTVINVKGLTNKKVQCKCDCGTIKIVSIYDLLNGKIKSCGCLRKELLQDRYQKEAQAHVGEKYGKLTILEPIKKGKGYYYRCLCDCGNETIVAANHLFNGHTKSCGCLISWANTTFQKILEELQIKYKAEYTFEGLVSKRGRRLRFDFALFNQSDELVGLVELNGSQHYITVGTGYFTKEKCADLKEHDQKKINFCITNEIPLLIIPYHYFKYEQMKEFFLTSNLSKELV